MKDRLLIQNSRPKAMSLFYDILYRLSNEFSENDNVLFPATDYLENNFSDPLISNTLLADKCNISEIYFRRLFKKRFGISPKQYVLELRLRKAKQLLLQDNISVTKVSEQCGFTNPYHFSRAFHKITGLTPTEYRKENKLIII
jgi:AraC-like DNA-binding protein